MSLDSLRIYGDRIGMLWGDVCGSHAGTVIAVLRARQLGVAGVTDDVLNYAIDHHGEGLDVEAAIKAVHERLPQFNINAGIVKEDIDVAPKGNFFKRFFAKFRLSIA
ncbi:MAG: hypothetical protein AAB445_04200 [Patescibacteria group bacterium]